MRLSFLAVLVILAGCCATLSDDARMGQSGASQGRLAPLTVSYGCQ
jgi:hypothetical protein